MSKNYTVYHLHDDRSLADSATKFSLYVKKALSLGQKAICLTNHGYVYNWISNKVLCDLEGIKYMHGVEVYMTETLNEKIRDNYHTVLIAKNYDGVLEINKLLSMAGDGNHFYYKPRITFDEFLLISENVIKISACMGGPLNRYNGDQDILEKLLRHYDYYEIQYHNVKEQIEYNKKLYEWSIKYNKPLIAGTDTHSLDLYKEECRRILQRAKWGTGSIKEDSSQEECFDLTYKSYEELVNMFKEQNSLDESIIAVAIENTNVMADSVVDFELDTSFKYPKIYSNEEDDIKERINRMFASKISDGIIDSSLSVKYNERILEEFSIIKKNGMISYILFMSELVCWCHENDIPTGPARGSASGCLIAYILDITDVDPIIWKTTFSRFANEYRLELADIDVDFAPDDREKVYAYIFDRFGNIRASHILSMGTVAVDGCIDLIGRGLVHPDGSRMYSIEEVSKIKAEFKNNKDATVEKYKDIFYYYEGLIGNIVSESVHPAGVVISPVDLDSHYGILYDGDISVLQIDMDDAHHVNLVKYDILGLKNIGIIKDACKLAGIEYPKTYSFKWDDGNVFDEIMKSPIGIFQYEGAFAHNSLKKFNARSIDDMSIINGAIRPSGASYRDKLLLRVPNKNPSEIIDNLFSSTSGYIVYQEQIISFLQEVCGFSGGLADMIRRAISKKDASMMNEYMPQILDGYCKKSDKPREQSEVEVLEFIKILEDASDYMFSYNHSTPYSMIGYICGYLRCYHPLEFITAFLNNSKDSTDFYNGFQFIKDRGIALNGPKFRYSMDKYYMSKDTNSIYKGLSSIKGIGASSPKILYDIGKDFSGSFLDLLRLKLGINEAKMRTLIDVDYFSEFGTRDDLTEFYNLFILLKSGNAKQISKTIDIDDVIIAIIKRNSTETTCKYKVTDIDLILSESYDYIMSKNTEYAVREKVTRCLSIMGESNISTGIDEDRFKLIALEISPIKKKSDGSIWARRIKFVSIGSGRESELTVFEKTFAANKIDVYDVVQINPSNITKKEFGNYTNWYISGYQVESR